METGTVARPTPLAPSVFSSSPSVTSMFVGAAVTWEEGESTDAGASGAGGGDGEAKEDTALLIVLSSDDDAERSGVAGGCFGGGTPGRTGPFSAAENIQREHNW